MSLSIAMIMKNEERVLMRCLESIKDLGDELIIVDTGSTDKSIEIAKQYTNNVYDFTWVNDFSAARNFSFSKCLSNHILWLDADDIITTENYHKIKNLDLMSIDMCLFKYHYSHGANNEPTLILYRERIVRRSLNLQWVGEIHEYIPCIPNNMKFDISIDHYKQQCTSNRNLELLKKAVKKNPNNSRNLFYLAKELNDNANFAEAEPYFLKFIECQDAFYENKITALELLAQHARNEYSFKSFIFKSLRLEDCRKEPYYLLGMYYFDNKNFLAAIHYYKICIATERNPDLLGSSLTFYTSNSWLQLCLCYNSLGRMKEAYEANEKYLELTGKNEIGLNNRKLLSKYINTKKDGLGKKLNIGCGAKKIEGYVSCDVFKTPIVDEIFSMDDVPYLDNTISAIYSEHSLEHLCFADATKALKEWFRCLQYGGELNLLIPDLELCCKGYLESTNEAQINYIPAKTWYTMCIFGAQTDQNGSIAKHQFHLSGWSKQEIKCLLEAVGFVVNSIENYNGWGTLSINIHALKPRQVEKTLEIKTCWVCANNEEGAQARIRVLNVSKELQKQGFVSDVIQDYNKALEYDIIIIGKSFSEYDYNSVKILKDKGKTVYCDLCEDILEFPFVADIIKVCDKIICCSQKLAEKVSIINKNTIIIEEAYEA